ncbi:MAG: regulatory iron-sulfur-containing complex subunit RicT [Candidatus Kapabacteria bacterium]|nr:regulatory iron-sulfur-containing complex subunit RicT [Candidatus Kapabacteria bacterium]
MLVQVENGMDMGTVTACGLIAYDKYCQSYGDNPKKRLMPIIRIADQNDYENLKRNAEEEKRAVAKTEELAERFNLDMKVTDADWQFDRQRLTVSFTAPQRIDFRLLVKELARTFRTRIELRQISTREEAKRIGGMGPCGRTLCCAGIGGENCHVTLDHARVQQLSNNVAKLSGYCGRLKCCLLYEYPVYAEASKKFPPLNSRILLPEGEARVIKADIFKETVYVHIPKAGIYKSLTCDELDVLREKKKVLSPPNDNYHHHHNSKHEYDNNPEELKDLEKQ